MSSSYYDPKLSQAGFMDLVVALQSQLKTADSLLLLSRMPPAQREAALQLGVVAKNYVDVVEGRGSPLALVDSHAKTNEHEFTQALTERDKAEDMADQLAAQISAITGHEIGEHTSANDPWLNALQAAREWNADASYDRGVADARAVFSSWVEPSDDLRKHPDECLGGIEGLQLLDNMANKIRVTAWPTVIRPLPMGTKFFVVTQTSEDLERLQMAYEAAPLLPGKPA